MSYEKVDAVTLVICNTPKNLNRFVNVDVN